MQTIVIFYRNKAQLDAFTESVFNLKIKNKIEIFRYRLLQVIITNRPLTLMIEKAFAVFLDIDESFSETVLCPSCVAIVDSRNKNAMEILLRCGTGAIVCGKNPSDTVSFSSITDDTLTVCQQRFIKTVDGRIIEPREFPFKYKSQSVETALLSAAVQTVIKG